ncbi:iron-containing alcohol dehydrogenase [Bacillus testis]|uniref:iron-containing alcohol dehydrogenase n=1 Tax=Bacillus testis TaxID=1622072 RepID=UPI00067F5C88|nr:iron-containing alcohol dehydrogenase [Bacillus testis]
MKGSFTCNIPTIIEFGTKKVHLLLDYIKEMKGSRAMVVTNQKAVQSGIAERVAKILDHGRIPYLLYDSVPLHPLDTDCMEAFRRAKKEKVDLLIGLGSGECIDMAKVVGVLLAHGGTARERFGPHTLIADSTPLIAIPTVLGTGSATSFLATVTDAKTLRKRVIYDRRIAPKVAILDPDITDRLSARTMAFDGLAALAQAVDAYTQREADPFSEALSGYAIELMAGQFQRDLEEMEARQRLMMGGLMAGIAYNFAEAKTVRIMAESLSGLYGMRSEEACILALPVVFEYHMPFYLQKHAEAAKKLGVDPRGKTTEETACEAIEKWKTLAAPLTLDPVGSIALPEARCSEAEELAARAAHLSSDMATRGPLTQKEFILLFGQALSGGKRGETE